MKDFRKKLVMAPLIAGLLCGVAGCSGQNGGGSAAGDSAAGKPAGDSPKSSETLKPVTFTWLANNRVEGPVRQDWEIFKQIEQKTGVHLDFQVVSQEGYNEKKQILIAGNSVTDFIQVTNQEGREYGPEKVFLNLKDYLDSAPNLKKFYDANPEAKAQATASDGGYYTVPTLESSATSKGFNYAWYARKDLMDKYGLKPPTTLDEFYQFLKAFKEKNPDSYPLTMRPPTNLNTTGLYGVMNRAFTGIEGFINLNPNDDQYEFAPYNSKFKDELLYMNKLYSEKLIDPEFSLLTLAQWQDRLMNGKSFVTYWWKADMDPLADQAHKANAANAAYNLDAIPQFAADGVKNYQYGRPAVGTSGFAISANVKDKQAAVKFLDYLVSAEGTNYLSLGIQGKTYDVVDGKPRYKPEFGTSPYTPLRRDYGVWFPTIVFNNAIARDAWEAGLDDKNKAINDSYAKYIIPAPKSFVETADEIELEKAKLDSLNKFLDQKTTEFVIGKTPINDDTIKQFIDQAKKLGVDDLLNMYNTAYKRTYSSK